jgi:hypothetical protein
MAGRKVAAIHQPNFFPWLGFFDKIASADVVVLLDNVQFPRTSTGTWVNRVKLLVAGREHWATAAVARAGIGAKRIADVELDDSSKWRSRLLKTLQSSYGRAPYFESVYPVIGALLTRPTRMLVELNIAAIAEMCRRLGFDDGKLVRGSTLGASGQATDLLVSITQAVGATAYLCGGGASGYQQDDKFAAAGIELVYQRFSHPTYPQAGSSRFIPGLSIIDALMNCGFEQTSALLRRRIPLEASPL